MGKCYGYLRETIQEANKAKPNKNNNMHKTGLLEYLNVIFPDVNDWVWNKTIPNAKRRFRPDYRSEQLKLIIEFNGVHHYRKPNIIVNDKEKEMFYEQCGYKVVMIPYFIQLSNSTVKTLFNVEVKEQLFDETIPSLFASDECTPAFLCPLGIEKMAEDFLKFPKQYEVNMNQMQKEDIILTRWDLLEQEYNKRLI